jgi:cobalamin biosynthesis protein CobT
VRVCVRARRSARNDSGAYEASIITHCRLHASVSREKLVKKLLGEDVSDDEMSDDDSEDEDDEDEEEEEEEGEGEEEEEEETIADRMRKRRRRA